MGGRVLSPRWQAIEVVNGDKLTAEADVWSFGVVVWEIMSLASLPYQGRYWFYHYYVSASQHCYNNDT